MMPKPRKAMRICCSLMCSGIDAQQIEPLAPRPGTNDLG